MYSKDKLCTTGNTQQLPLLIHRMPYIYFRKSKREKLIDTTYRNRGHIRAKFLHIFLSQQIYKMKILYRHRRKSGRIVGRNLSETSC